MASNQASQSFSAGQIFDVTADDTDHSAEFDQNAVQNSSENISADDAIETAGAKKGESDINREPANVNAASDNADANKTELKQSAADSSKNEVSFKESENNKDNADKEKESEDTDKNTEDTANTIKKETSGSEEDTPDITKKAEGKKKY